MFSRRANWNATTNRLAEAREKRVGRGEEILDLTVSNPTTAGLVYPIDELSEALARGARAPYAPEPFGLRSAREALASELRCDADDLVLTASTSEAYSYLFKLLADPGDEIVTAIPSYPLLEHLSAMEMISLRTFALEFLGRWHLEAGRVREALSERSRALVVVNPNNPTGSYVRQTEQDELARFRVPVISDEVFFDYPLDDAERVSFTRADVLTFTMGGLSKSAGLPHYKLGWIRVNGPRVEKRNALQGLELIADTFLSVATPVQAALPKLLPLGRRIRDAIHGRCRSNLEVLRAAIAGNASVTLLPVEGGWSAVLRIPRTESDEEFAVRLLEDQGVLTHPGYFFDFGSDGYVVVSLLPPAEVLSEGTRRMLSIIAG